MAAVKFPPKKDMQLCIFSREGCRLMFNIFSWTEPHCADEQLVVVR